MWVVINVTIAIKLHNFHVHNCNKIHHLIMPSLCCRFSCKVVRSSLWCRCLSSNNCIKIIHTCIIILRNDLSREKTIRIPVINNLVHLYFSWKRFSNINFIKKIIHSFLTFNKSHLEVISFWRWSFSISSAYSRIILIKYMHGRVQKRGLQYKTLLEWWQNLIPTRLHMQSQYLYHFSRVL
jgi:hypothetical protein